MSPASTATAAAQLELISSLSADEIPIKLRCAICSKLAVNAFRLPCCDQIICESCQSTLPSSCPVCEHTPVSAEDCKPNKALRTTIKIFLRTEEKKRETARLKEFKNTPPTTPLEVESTPIDPIVTTELTTSSEVPAEANNDNTPVSANDNADDSAPAEAPAAEAADAEQSDQAQEDIPQPSIEEIAPGQESTADGDVTNVEDDSADKEGQDDDRTGADGDKAAGFNVSVAGGFPMGFNGEMNPMQQQMMMMMATQNGMGAGGFGSFPMMGMPGMNMDPMAMQSMFMNGGFGAGGMGMGMGMGGMPMGIGMGGFDSGMGAGFSNNWNGQQSWSNDSSFNPHAAGMGQGDYGANNFGNASHSNGFNQGNSYGRGNHYNDFQNNFGPGYRGRGRGRGGGYGGRGGYGYGSNDAFSHQLPQQFGNSQQANRPTSETGSIPTGPKADFTPAADGTDEFGREIRPKSEEPEDNAEKTNGNDATFAQKETGITAMSEAGADAQTEITGDSAPEVNKEGSTMPIQTFDEAQAAAFQNSDANGYEDGWNNGNVHAAARGGFQHGFRGGRGDYNAMQPPVKPVDVPINAPKGPKAMREGLPNTSLANLRGRGFSHTGRPGNSRMDTSASASVAPESSEKDNQNKDRSRSPSRERSRSRERRRSRSRSRDRRRKHRHHSVSRSENEKETEKRRERRRERRRQREADDAERGDDVIEDIGDGERAEPLDDRSRSASPSESKRSGHRSRRDRDKYRERVREDDREHKSSSHKHRSSRRSHRDDRSRSHDRDRDRDREHRHHHSRHVSEDVADKNGKVSDAPKDGIVTPIKAKDSLRRLSVISNGGNGIEIKGASTRNKVVSDEIKIPTGPRKDRVSSSVREREVPRSSSNRHRRDEDNSHRSSRHRDAERSSVRDKDREREKSRKEEPKASAPAQDPHTIEREARNRERLLKEAQRIAGLSSGMGNRKRSHIEEEDIGSGRKGRKKGRRSGGVAAEDEESRLARMEAERENARWD